MKISFKKFSTFAKAPTRVTPASAGFNLYLSHDVPCHPRSCTIVQTDIGFEIPPEYFGKIHPRSSFTESLTDAVINFSNIFLFIKRVKDLNKSFFRKKQIQWSLKRLKN